MLRALTLTNFKSFESATLSLGRLTLLVSTFALSGLERGGLGSAAKPVRPSGQAGRRCAPVAGVEFLRIGRLEWT